MGDSRGRWEGDTLVVDTMSFTDKTVFRGSGEHLHLVERFTRVDADTLEYRFTAEDPTTWTRRGRRRAADEDRPGRCTSTPATRATGAASKGSSRAPPCSASHRTSRNYDGPS